MCVCLCIVVIVCWKHVAVEINLKINICHKSCKQHGCSLIHLYVVLLTILSQESYLFFQKISKDSVMSPSFPSHAMFSVLLSKFRGKVHC